jgi:hypothetical protein
MCFLVERFLVRKYSSVNYSVRAGSNIVWFMVVFLMLSSVSFTCFQASQMLCYPFLLGHKLLLDCIGELISNILRFFPAYFIKAILVT